LVERQPESVSSPSGLAALYPRVKQLEAAISDYKSALREALADGPVTVDGVTYSMGESSRESIDAGVAWRVLQGEVSEQRFMGLLSVKKGGLEELAAGDAPHGGKAEAKRELMRRLRDAGAVTRSTFTRINSKRVKS